MASSEVYYTRIEMTHHSGRKHGWHPHVEAVLSGRRSGEPVCISLFGGPNARVQFPINQQPCLIMIAFVDDA